LKREILEYIKEKRKVDPDEIAEHFRLERGSIIFMLGKLARKTRSKCRHQKHKSVIKGVPMAGDTKTRTVRAADRQLWYAVVSIKAKALKSSYQRIRILSTACLRLSSCIPRTGHEVTCSYCGRLNMDTLSLSQRTLMPATPCTRDA